MSIAGFALEDSQSPDTWVCMSRFGYVPIVINGDGFPDRLNAGRGNLDESGSNDWQLTLERSQLVNGRCTFVQTKPCASKIE
jgi:hypothetical protein